MTDTRKCTCHPDDNPPIPCARKYALHDCLKERIQQLEEENNRLEKAWYVMHKRCFEYEVTLGLRKETDK